METSFKACFKNLSPHIRLSSQPKQRPCNHQRFKHFTSQKLSRDERDSRIEKVKCECVCVCVQRSAGWKLSSTQPEYIYWEDSPSYGKPCFTKVTRLWIVARVGTSSTNRFKGFFWLGALPELGQQPTCFQLQEHLPEDPHHLQVLQAFGSRVGGWSTDFRKQI